MKNSITLYINGQRHDIAGKEALLTVAQYLRYIKGLTGTKIVCSEGDCGACTILYAKFNSTSLGAYEQINSCIAPMYQMDKCHIISVEGLGNYENPHPVQKAMRDCHGAQCGYCTPGIVCALASMSEDAKNKIIKIDEKKVKNYLTGNLCRCTGYEPIIKAGMQVDLENVKAFSQVYSHKEMENTFKSFADQNILIEYSDKSIYLPHSFKEFFNHGFKEKFKIISGGTDLGVLLNKNKIHINKFISLNNTTENCAVTENSDHFEIGAMAKFPEIEKKLAKDFPDFSNLLHIFASPQIKNKATLVGNLVNASPIADTIPFLKVADTRINILGINGARQVHIDDFFLGGYKEIDLSDNEIITSVIIPKTKESFKTYKVSIRKDLDISSVTFAAKYSVKDKKIDSLQVAYGGVGPVVMRLNDLEKMAKGMNFERDTFYQLSDEVLKVITPMDDVRGSADYRKLVAKNLMLKFFSEASV